MLFGVVGVITTVVVGVIVSFVTGNVFDALKIYIDKGG